MQATQHSVSGHKQFKHHAEVPKDIHTEIQTKVEELTYTAHPVQQTKLRPAKLPGCFSPHFGYKEKKENKGKCFKFTEWLSQQ